MFCSEQEFGLGRPVAIDFESELAFWQEQLVARQVPFRIVDEQVELGPDRRRLVLVPGLGMLDGAAAERLCEWQASGAASMRMARGRCDRMISSTWAA